MALGVLDSGTSLYEYERETQHFFDIVMWLQAEELLEVSVWWLTVSMQGCENTIPDFSNLSHFLEDK